MNKIKKFEQLDAKGLDLNVAKDIKQNYVQFLEPIGQAIEDAKGINKENPTLEDEALARTIRLSLVPNRTAAHKFKMARTEKIRLMKGLEDAAYRLIENESKLIEGELSEIENARAIKEAKEKEARKLKREEIAREFIENPESYPLAAMNDEQFDKFIEDQKLAKQAREKIEAENKAKAEAERKAAIEEQKKKDAEAKRLAKENARLKAEADKKAKAEEEEKIAQKAKESARVGALLRLLGADGWEKDEAGFSKEGHFIKNAHLAEHSLSTLDAFIKLTNKEIEEERKQKEAEQLKKSPDKEQLKQWIENLTIPEVNLNSEEGIKAYSEIRVKFEGFKGWALKLTEQL